VGAKDSKNAASALSDAADQPADKVPAPIEAASKDCTVKHWIAVRVEFEDHKLVETGILKKLKLNNGQTQDVTLDPGTQAGGNYSTGKILDLSDDCEVCFPDMYDAECTPK
jgi:maltose-binding protein MalE